MHCSPARPSRNTRRARYTELGLGCVSGALSALGVLPQRERAQPHSVAIVMTDIEDVPAERPGCREPRTEVGGPSLKVPPVPGSSTFEVTRRLIEGPSTTDFACTLATGAETSPDVTSSGQSTTAARTYRAGHVPTHAPRPTLGAALHAQAHASGCHSATPLELPESGVKGGALDGQSSRQTGYGWQAQFPGSSTQLLSWGKSSSQNSVTPRGPGAVPPACRSVS